MISASIPAWIKDESCVRAISTLCAYVLCTVPGTVQGTSPNHGPGKLAQSKLYSEEANAMSYAYSR